jgi:hypothetical protein
MMMKKTVLLILVSFLLSVNPPVSQASPWSEHSSYAGKTAGKFWFGLKNSVFGWMAMFVEAEKKEYPRKWNGFCVGIARSVVYTANGLIHLATFPIPVDFPNVGKGLGLPEVEKPSAALARQREQIKAIQAEMKREEYEAKKPVPEAVIVQAEPEKTIPVTPPVDQARALEERRQTLPASAAVPAAPPRTLRRRPTATARPPVAASVPRTSPATVAAHPLPQTPPAPAPTPQPEPKPVDGEDDGVGSDADEIARILADAEKYYREEKQ